MPLPISPRGIYRANSNERDFLGTAMEQGVIAQLAAHLSGTAPSFIFQPFSLLIYISFSGHYTYAGVNVLYFFPWPHKACESKCGSGSIQFVACLKHMKKNTPQG